MSEDAIKLGLWARTRGLVVNQLKRGATPHELALTVAVASALSLFPVLGSTTLLCLVVGAALKLNHPLMQGVNYLLAGLQLLLIIPLWKAGEWIGAPHLALSFDQLKARFDAAPWQSIKDFGDIVLGGIGIWAIAAPIWITTLYFIARPLLQRLARRRQDAAQRSAAA